MSELSPPLIVTAPPYIHQSNHGSIGAFIAVLVAVTILGVVAAVVGRLCTGRRIMGYGKYDMESWAERRCSSCIDGTIHVNPQRTNNNVAVTTTLPAQNNQGNTDSNIVEQAANSQNPSPNSSARSQFGS